MVSCVIDASALDVEGSKVGEKPFLFIKTSAAGAFLGEIAERLSGKTNVRRANCFAGEPFSAFGDAVTIGIPFIASPNASGTTLHFQDDSSPIDRFRPFSSNDPRLVEPSGPDTDSGRPERLPSRRPIYDVLARTATETIV